MSGQPDFPSFLLGGATVAFAASVVTLLLFLTGGGRELAAVAIGFGAAGAVAALGSLVAGRA